MISRFLNIDRAAISAMRFDECVLALIFMVMFAGVFFLPTAPHRILMYLGMPFMAFFLMREQFWSYFKSSVPILLSLVFVFVGFYALSAFWSEGADIDRVFSKVKLAVFIPLTLMSFFVLLQKYSALWSWMMNAYVLAAVISAAILLVMHFDIYVIDHNYHHRLQGMGKAFNSVHCSLFHGLALIALMFHMQSDVRLFESRYVRFFAILLLFLVVVLTNSRGPFLALCGTFAFLKFFRGHIKVLFISFCVLIPSVALAINFLDLSLRSIDRRYQIWVQAFDIIQQKLLLGHGAGSKFFYEITIGDSYHKIEGHAHNLYLSTLIHVGIFGFILMCLVIARALFIGVIEWRKRGEIVALAFLVFGLIAGLFDFGGYFTNLGATWIVFWFPVTVIAAYEYAGNTKMPKPIA